MFRVPEGEKLFLFTKARKAINTARLFMAEGEMETIEAGLSTYHQKIDELVDEAIIRGWKPNADDATARLIEDQAAIYVERNVPGYKKACEKQDSLFGSALDQS